MHIHIYKYIRCCFTAFFNAHLLNDYVYLLFMFLCFVYILVILAGHPLEVFMRYVTVKIMSFTEHYYEKIWNFRKNINKGIKNITFARLNNLHIVYMCRYKLLE